MQWAIDYLLKHFTQAVGYYNRGDPAIFDWELSDLIADNNWHDLNLSAIVPAGATIVRFSVLHSATSTSARIMMRQNGNANNFNIASMRCQVGSLNQDETFLVSPDADRIIEYRIVGGFTTFLRLTVCGWWMGGNALNISINRGDPAVKDFETVDFTIDNAWHDLNLTAIIPAMTGFLFCTVEINYNAIGRLVQFRTKGNVNRPNVSAIRSVAVNSPNVADITIPTAGNQIIQYKIEHTDFLNISLTVKSWSF